MRGPLLLLACLGGLSAGGAVAQTTPPPDWIGIYFDQGGSSQWECPEAYSLVTAYLVVKDLSESSGLAAWEARVSTYPTQSYPVSYTLLQPGVSLLAEPDFQVALSSVAPSAPAIPLLSMQILYLAGPLFLTLGATDPTVFPADPGPGYAPGSDPTAWRPLAHSTWAVGAESPNMWRAAIIGDYFPGYICAPDPIEGSTWGALKRLYD